MKKKWLFAAAAAAGAAYAGVSALLFYEIFHRNASAPGKIYQSNSDKIMRNTDTPPKSEDPRDVWMKAQTFEDVTLQNAAGHTLTAHYLPAEGESDRWVLCAHGYRSSGKGEFRLMTKYYHDHGFHVVLPDHRASGSSEGNLISFGKHESEDLLLWLRWICERNPDARVVLHGVSMGAATVLMLSDNDALLPNVRFITSDCAFTGVTDQFRAVLDTAHIPLHGLIPGVDAANRIANGFSLRDVQPSDHVRNAVVPILFIHGDADTFVPTGMTLQNYEACTSPKALLLVAGAGHAGSYPKDSASYEAMLNDFIQTYVEKDAQ